MTNASPEAERSRSADVERAAIEHVAPPQFSPSTVPPSQITPPPPQKPWWRSVHRKALWLVIPLGIAAQQWCARSLSPTENALDEMKALLEKQYLAAPSTAKWIERKVLSHEGAYWQGHFVLDAQNQFGAMIRERLCIVVELRGDGQVRWNRRFFVEEKCDVDNANLLRLHRELNDWGKSTPDEAKSPGTTAPPSSKAGEQPCNEDGWCVVANDDSLDTRDVWGSGPNDIWAVGGDVARHWDGKAWTRMNFSGLKGTVASIGGSGPDDIWLSFEDTAAGTASLVHWDGKKWARAHVREKASPGGIWASGARDAWAVGSIIGGGGYIYHWNGEAWSLSADKLDAEDGGMMIGRLEDVWGTSADDVWAVGSAIFHWDGREWKRKVDGKSTKHLYGVWAGSRNNAWAVGNDGTALHWDGSEWAKTDTKVDQLYGVWGTGQRDVWAVGSQGVIIRWDGHRWSHVSSGTTVSLMKAWGLNQQTPAGSSMWVVGDGLILRHANP